MAVLRFQVSSQKEGGEARMLTLSALDGTHARWWKLYPNRLELGFDALELGLLERGSTGEKQVGPMTLCNEVELDAETLVKFKFTKEQVI